VYSPPKKKKNMAENKNETKSLHGIVVIGQYFGAKPSEYKKKDGTIVRSLTVAVNVGDLQNVLINVPADYVLERSASGEVMIPVQASARRWNEQDKRFEFVNVQYELKRL